jgi:hypothetical protein
MTRVYDSVADKRARAQALFPVSTRSRDLPLPAGARFSAGCAKRLGRDGDGVVRLTTQQAREVASGASEETMSDCGVDRHEHGRLEWLEPSLHHRPIGCLR